MQSRSCCSRLWVSPCLSPPGQEPKKANAERMGGLPVGSEKPFWGHLQDGGFTVGSLKPRKTCTLEKRHGSWVARPFLGGPPRCWCSCWFPFQDHNKNGKLWKKDTPPYGANPTKVGDWNFGRFSQVMNRTCPAAPPPPFPCGVYNNGGTFQRSAKMAKHRYPSPLTFRIAASTC